jgi:hypothetical protein
MINDVCSWPEEHGGSAVGAEYREKPHPARRRENTRLWWIWSAGCGGIAPAAERSLRSRETPAGLAISPVLIHDRPFGAIPESKRKNDDPSVNQQ